MRLNHYAVQMQEFFQPSLQNNAGILTVFYECFKAMKSLYKNRRHNFGFSGHLLSVHDHIISMNILYSFFLAHEKLQAVESTVRQQKGWLHL